MLPLSRYASICGKRWRLGGSSHGMRVGLSGGGLSDGGLSGGGLSGGGGGDHHMACE